MDAGERLPLERGAFCVSIDLELAWGVWDMPDEDTLRRVREQEHDIVHRLLEAFARHGVPATWAVVAQLMERERDAAVAPGDDALWFAPDLIEAIRIARPPHEIGSHSFHHPVFSALAPGAANAELAAARRVHHAHGLEFRSFVYPRNAVAHREALKEAGLSVFRSVDAGLLELAGRVHPMVRKAVNLGEKLVPLPPPVVWPLRHADGLVELPSSMLLMARNGLRRLIHPRLMAAKARQGLHAAQRRHGLFHLWFHPSNFYYETETQFAIFEAVLAEAARLRDAGALDVRTMGSFAA